MKSIFDIILIIFITIAMFISMMFFTEEVFVGQQAIQIRNRVINLVEIDGGYTDNVKNTLQKDLMKFNNKVIINASKEGELEYGEEVEIEVIISHKRKLPFFNIEKDVSYISKGVFYNVNP